MKQIILTSSLSLMVALAADAQFTAGQLAVLQLGDGGPGRCAPLGAITGITSYNPSDIVGSRQNQLFIDQFDPLGANQTIPSFQVAIPTNGPGAMLINGNAGTEGNLTRSGDRSLLAFTAYQGDICSIVTGGQTAPSNLSYDRGIGTVDAAGSYVNVYRGGAWYGIATGKTNPRGVATDGAGNFWGCGNGYGSLYFNPLTASEPIQFQNIALTSATKVINDTLYASVKGSESVGLYPAGIYSFVDFFNDPVTYPNAASFLHLAIQAALPYTNCIGFDINPQGTVAYVADTARGVQKYVRSGLAWALAYNLAIPGYTNQISGTLTNAGATNVLVGAFSVTVDWAGANPVVYATTSDTAYQGNPYYGNRVVRINDTNTASSGASLVATTNVLTTVVQPPGAGPTLITNLVFKSVAFTPDLRPLITNNPVSVSAVAGDNVSFTVGASSTTLPSYQWQENGTNLPGQNGATLALVSVALADDAATYRCVVGNAYGSVTSAIATLTVTSVAVAPTFGAVQNLTNYVGNNQSIILSVSGTDPKGGFQWFHNGALLTDAGEYNGTTTPALSITQASTNDAGAYSAIVTNVAGPASNVVANLYMVYSAPVMIQPPIPILTFAGRTITNAASAYGQLLTYQWYTTKANGTTPIALSDGVKFSGTATATLTIANTATSDSTNYVVVISNPGGSITSAPAALTVQTAPPHTFVAYTNAGQIYSQDFNALPIPGLSSAEGANPLHITYVMTNVAAMLTNGNPAINASGIAAELQYSVDNPVDFGYPIFASGGIGGWGLSNRMSGWYGWCQNSIIIAAGRGDQSQGAVIDNGGNYYADGAPLSGITNRSLGLVATTKTGPVAFGAAFINRTTSTLNTVNLSYIGELWRNNPNQQPVQFGYFIDPEGTNSTFHPDLWDSTNAIQYVSSLDVAFPTSISTTINDGTQASNQVDLAVSGLTIADWPAGAALWLVWQGHTLGTAQDIAIDNLSLVAGLAGAPTVLTQPATGLTPVGAKLNGTVNPNTLATTAYFEYGTNASHGSLTATNSLAAGISGVAVTNVISGLLPNTIYHFRAVANNSLGTSFGSDLTFITAPVPAPILRSVAYGAGGFRCSFTNLPGVTFTMLSTTNVALLLNLWQNVGQPIEGPAGQYQFADPQATNRAAQFYLLRQP